MTTTPSLSIVLPVYNGAKHLPEALASVHAQTFRHWELLLVDDGSTDASVDLMRREASTHGERVRYLEHPNRENRGTLATRVLGARCARSPLLALLDQDDVWNDRYLEGHLAIWSRAGVSDLGLSYGPGTYWYPDRARKDRVQPVPGGAPKLFGPGELLGTYLSSGFANTPCPSCTLIRREALLQAARFESVARMSPCEDQYLWWSVALRWRVSVHAEPMVRYRQHDESACATLMASPAQAVKSELAFLERISDDVASVRHDDPVLFDLANRIEMLRLAI